MYGWERNQQLAKANRQGGGRVEHAGSRPALDNSIMKLWSCFPTAEPESFWAGGTQAWNGLLPPTITLRMTDQY